MDTNVNIYIGIYIEREKARRAPTLTPYMENGPSFCFSSSPLILKMRDPNFCVRYRGTSLICYRGTSLIGNKPPFQDHHRIPGIVLL